MLKGLRWHSESLLLALVVWLCSLPLIVLIVLPLLGLKAAGLAAPLLFFVILAICWGLCSWQVFQDRIRRWADHDSERR